MGRRRGLLAILIALPLPAPPAGTAAEPSAGPYSSEAIRRRAEAEARRREAWWERQRRREADERVDREWERRREATRWQVERWRSSASGASGAGADHSAESGRRA